MHKDIKIKQSSQGKFTSSPQNGLHLKRILLEFGGCQSDVSSVILTYLFTVNTLIFVDSGNKAFSLTSQTSDRGNFFVCMREKERGERK